MHIVTILAILAFSGALTGKAYDEGSGTAPYWAILLMVSLWFLCGAAESLL